MSRHLTTWFDRAWWSPFAFVALAVGVLLCTPILVNRAMRDLGLVIDQESRARVLLNDLEAAGATEALIAQREAQTGSNQPSTRVDDSAAAAAAISAEKDERGLDSLFRGGDPNELGDLSTIKRVEQSWRGSSVPSSIAADSQTHADALALFAAAERLDVRVSERLDAARDRAHRLQQLNVTLAVILTPVAVLSVLAVFWTARRYRSVAHGLEREHAALAESLDTRAALLRGIAHDVKNPLGAAAGYADLLTDGVAGGPLTDAQSTMVRRIRKLLDNSLDTMSELLHTERTASDLEARGSAPTDIAALVRDVVDDYRAAATEKSLALEIHADKAPVLAWTRPGPVQHILGNLLSNAVKYTPPHGHVCVRLAAEHLESDGADGPAGVCIEVRDDGPGVPPALRDRVFDEFFRVDESATQAQGHGVGLAISRRFARLLGGEITLADAPEGGAMFTLRLPAIIESGASAHEGPVTSERSSGI